MTKTSSTSAPPPLAKSAKSIVRAENIHKSFRMGEAEVHVLQKVDLTIRTGEFIAIEGRSGSGKSTLLHIMGALDAPDTGHVFFHDEEYTRARSDRAGRGIVGLLTRRIFLIIIFALHAAAGV